MGAELQERAESGPPGLRNYGATCYANAFLQVWFHNVSFRNGVFEAVGDRVNPLFHLAKIFAAMRYTRRPVVDPGALIEALRLNKGAQQDAAEFSKLFMDLIEKQFKAQGGPLADFVSEQFAGQLEYRTKCNRCGYTSSTTSPFMELEIPLRDGCTLEDQLRNMLTPELLDGDNKYRCPQCTSLQPATRSTHLQHLPPALHFALNRFEYTPTSDERKKSKARIYYPHKLRLANVDYDLHGVVVHEGPKATQGHFTAEVYDEK
jgi:ubiquitin carboxyl-terminal hydrolase 48